MYQFYTYLRYYDPALFAVWVHGQNVRRKVYSLTIHGCSPLCPSGESQSKTFKVMERQYRKATNAINSRNANRFPSETRFLVLEYRQRKFPNFPKELTLGAISVHHSKESSSLLGTYPRFRRALELANNSQLSVIYSRDS